MLHSWYNFSSYVITRLKYGRNVLSRAPLLSGATDRYVRHMTHKSEKNYLKITSDIFHELLIENFNLIYIKSF